MNKIETMKMINDNLSKLGLKDKETEIYLAILGMGRGTITDISKKSGIKRTSVYQHLEVLLKEGLLYQTAVKKRIFYAPENPKKILSFMEKKKRDIDLKRQSIEKIIPELENIYARSFNKPQVSIYEGKSGIWEVYGKMTDTWQDIYSIFSPKAFFTLFSFEQNDKLLVRLEERGVKLHNLVEKSDTAFKRLKMKKYDSFVKSKVLPEELKFATDLLVTKDRLALISFSSLVAVVIEDKDIADMQRNFIKFIWKNAK
ncbi:MAG: helix-turn-helix domain-containing protein [Parcubacteria group bacterium]